MWWILIILGVILWGILGGTFPSTGSNGSAPTGGGCDGCKGLDLWWNGLKWGQKALQLVWYGWKKADCALKGCPT
jgi:hypothetical protein